MKLMVHVNRFELKKGKKGYPWTIHTSRGCIRAKEVAIEARAEAQCFPERKTQPKCFVVVHGKVKNLGKGRFVLLPEDGKAARVAMNGTHWLDPNRIYDVLKTSANRH